MAGYTAEQQAMTNGATAVESAATAINGHLAKLEGEIETMFGGWTGDAQRAFGLLHEAWTVQQTRLKVSLEQMHAALVQTDQVYNRQEQDQTDVFRQINNEL